MKTKKQNKTKQNRVEFEYLERAVNDRLFTGAIPLLFDAEAFACCVSTLDRFAFLKSTWRTQTPLCSPY